ncbi:MAG: Glu/Leu/Phe/Val dehydrogenase dimerization domain-containing protein [Acidimicrobiia bacterium]|nr:Glu/Leu/Phe/Val dehydrogenase dimerization domain-containing protein [Acidimicrobiia bacterium]
MQINRGLPGRVQQRAGPVQGRLAVPPVGRTSGSSSSSGFEQIFKNALTGLPIGGGKGGADFDPKGRSDDEVMRFCQSFMTELYRHLGEHTDVPAGDIGVGEREIGYLFGQYKRITNRYESGVLTGKGVDWGGSQVRTEATGYGTAFFAREMLRRPWRRARRARPVSSPVRATWPSTPSRSSSSSARRVVACSDSDGVVHDPDGIDLDLLKQVKEVERGRVSDYAEQRRPVPAIVAGGNIWELPCDVALPCATQNELTGARRPSRSSGNGCTPSWPRAPTCRPPPRPCARFRDAGVAFGPGQGGQRRRRGHLGARDAAERQPRPLDLRVHRATARSRS